MSKKKIVDPCSECPDKDTKKCQKCEHAAARASALVTVEEASRQVAVMGLEGDLPYDRNAYIREAKFFLSRSIEDILMAGKLLLVIKEKEGYGDFTRIIEDEIGIPHSTAYRYMNAAVKTELYPKIEFSQLGKVNVFTLLEAPEEDLKELENKGILAGRDIDELQRMSVKEMRNLIKELKQAKEVLAKGIEEEFKAERKALQKEIKRLSVFEPAEQDVEWATERMEQIAKLQQEFYLSLRGFAWDDRILEHPEIMAKIVGLNEEMATRCRQFSEDFDSRITDGLAQ